jgi:predicted phage tail protein
VRIVRVYGQLAAFLKRRTFRADVANAAEAVRFLLANFPQLERHMAQHHYRVSVGSYALSADELHDPAGQQEIRIVPVITGAGGGVGKIIAGVALVAAAIVFAPVGGGFLGLGMGVGGGVGAGALGTVASSLIGGIGAALAFGGVAQLLTPTPKINDPAAPKAADDADPRKNYSFSGIQNVSRQGVPVPVVYGLTTVGSVVISAGIDTV